MPEETLLEKRKKLATLLSDAFLEKINAVKLIFEEHFGEDFVDCQPENNLCEINDENILIHSTWTKEELNQIFNLPSSIVPKSN